MRSISLSPSFFRNELHAYSDWKSAFWRELVQNSVDAGASRISITLEEQDGNCIVKFHDNGPGMDLNTLQNVYFVLGETTRSGVGSIGGFGRARVVTCFAHPFRRINTQKLVCTGSGSQYEITPVGLIQDGCLVRVTISLASVAAMQEALDAYLQTCQLSCGVFVNGQRFEDWAYRNRISGELSFGKVYLNKSKQGYGVLVRVNGVHMFTRHTPASWQMVVEIDPECSREVLTSNRDGFTHQAAQELDDFIGEIWVNPLSAVRERYQKKREVFGEMVYSVTKKGAGHGQERSAFEANDESFVVLPTSAYSSDQMLTRDQAGQPGFSCAGLPAMATTLFLESQLKPHYVLAQDCCSRKLIAAAKHFHPDKIGLRQIKLLEKWTEACTIAAEELSEFADASFRFRTGFLFKEEDLGRCETHGEIHDLLFKPVTNDGKLAYRLPAEGTWTNF